jgi:hypothetical protein
MGFIIGLIGPTIIGWLLTGLASVVLLPIGAPRGLVPMRRWDLMLLGPMVWFGYRRVLQRAGVDHLASEWRNPIATLAVWTVFMALPAAWLGLEFTKFVARMTAQGEWWGDNVDIFTGLFLIRLAPLAVAWTVMSAILLLDLAAVLMRRARQRHVEAGQ